MITTDEVGILIEWQGVIPLTEDDDNCNDVFGEGNIVMTVKKMTTIILTANRNYPQVCGDS